MESVSIELGEHMLWELLVDNRGIYGGTPLRYFIVSEVEPTQEQWKEAVRQHCSSVLARKNGHLDALAMLERGDTFPVEKHFYLTCI